MLRREERAMSCAFYQLARELGNVSRACRLVGHSRRGGIEPPNKARRAGSVARSRSERFACSWPCFRQRRILVADAACTGVGHAT